MSRNRKIISYQDYKNGRVESCDGGIVVGTDISPGSAIDVAIEHSDVVVVAEENRGSFENIDKNWDDFVSNPSLFLINQDCEKRKVFSKQFSKDSVKLDFLKSLEDFLSKSAFRRTRGDLLLVADELFTNFSKTALDDTPIEFLVDSDKDRVLIACRDRFGTLEPRKMLKNIQSCYKFGVKNSICLEDSSGAGIGSFLMYSVSDGMAIVSELGQQCLVMCWLAKNEFHDDRIDSKKDLIVVRKGEK